eukprot:m.51654 g.51654  ORF g.51654 m.51654 type:complete len:162 (+) comp48333_c0_seq1:68-553(+)
MAALLRQLPRLVSRVGVRSLAEVATDSNKFVLTFTAPHSALFANKQVFQVNVPSSTGDFGILPNHVPVIASLKPGVVSVFDVSADNAKKFFVSSGTVVVNGDSSVQIMAEEAVPLEHLDVNVARQRLDKYSNKLASGSDADRLEAEVGVDVYSAMVKALEA